MKTPLLLSSSSNSLVKSCEYDSPIDLYFEGVDTHPHSIIQCISFLLYSRCYSCTICARFKSIRIIVATVIAVDNNLALTYDEVLYIGIITIGCTKLIARLANLDVQKFAISKSHQEIKSLVHTFIITKVPTIPIRHIRRKFPENLKIDGPNLSRLFDSLERTGHLRKLGESANDTCQFFVTIIFTGN